MGSPAISPLALPSPLYPVGSSPSGPSGAIRKQSPKKVLKSMVTKAKFVLGLPQDSLVCRRRMQTQQKHDIPSNSDPPTPSTSRSLSCWHPTCTTSTVDQVGSRASSEHLAAKPSSDAGSSVSVNSLARYVEQQAPGFFELTSTTTPTSSHVYAEEATFAEATIAMPLPIPQRGPSLMHLRILEAGLASRARRPILPDIDDDDATVSLVTHHINLIPTTFEIGVATAVRLYRPPPVRLIVVRGRAVAIDPPVNAPWDTLSGGEDGCTSQHHFWSKLKRKFRLA